MTAMLAIAAGGSLLNAYGQSEAIKAKSDFDAKQFELNSRIADMQSDEAIKQGDKAAAAQKTQAKRVVGAQRAALAAQGINIDSGSALDIQQETAEMGAVDAMTIKNNAWRESWGYKMNAANMRGQADITRISGQNQANNTLLTGGLQAASYGAKGFK